MIHPESEFIRDESLLFRLLHRPVHSAAASKERCDPFLGVVPQALSSYLDARGTPPPRRVVKS